MPHLGKNSKVRGSGHLILNALRVLTLIGLAVAIIASWAMIVLSGLTGHFALFDTLAHLFTFGFSLCLAISECGLFQAYFKNHFPVLAEGHSLTWLAVGLLAIGCQLLGEQAKPAYTVRNLGLPMWRLVFAAGILNIIFGCLNLLATIIFRDAKAKITARDIRRDGTLAEPTNKASYYEGSSLEDEEYSHKTLPVRQERGPGLMAGRRITRMFGFNKNTNRTDRSSPNHYHHSDLEQGDWRDDASCLNCRMSPVAPNVQRPETIYHPALAGRFDYDASSRYSEANISRF